MSERQIDLKRRKWKNVESIKWTWRVSQKGNEYMTHGGRTAVIQKREPDSGGKITYAYLLSPDDKKPETHWERSHAFDTVETAKLAALTSLGLIVVRTPVTWVAETTLIDAPPADMMTGKRKIVL